MPLAVCAAAGLEGAGEDVKSLSRSMGCGVGWSVMLAESRFSSSGGRLRGCES
jgi:hypothetical protein